MAVQKIIDAGPQSDGVQIGASATDKVGFHGTTPVVQRSGAAGAAVSTTVGAAVAATAATNSSPYGYAEAQANDLVEVVNELRADVIALAALANELRATLVASGIHTGAA